MDILKATNPLETVFLICALVSTIFFFIRVVMMLIGIGADHSDDVFNAHQSHDMHSDIAFEMLSINTITAFFMMFGWIGLTCYKEFAMKSLPSIGVAFLGGVFCMVLTAYLFKQMRKLASKGSSFTMNDAVGLTATVYQRIPAKGSGKINVVVRGMTREIEAQSEDQVDIESFKTVKVIRLVSDQSVSVKILK